jgi:hypothetical protein
VASRGERRASNRKASARCVTRDEEADGVSRSKRVRRGVHEAGDSEASTKEEKTR